MLHLNYEVEKERKIEDFHIVHVFTHHFFISDMLGEMVENDEGQIEVKYIQRFIWCYKSE